MLSMADELEAVKATARRVRRATTALDAAKADHLAAAIEALKAGVPPTDVVNESTFSDAYLRQRARNAGIPRAVRTSRRDTEK